MGMMFKANVKNQKYKDKLAKAKRDENKKKAKALAERKKKRGEENHLLNLKAKAETLEIDVVGKDTIASLEKKIAARLEEIKEEQENEELDEGLIEALSDFNITPKDGDTNEILKKKLKEAINNEIAEDKKKKKEDKKDPEKKEEKKPSLLDKIKNKIAPKKPLSKLNKGELVKIATELKIKTSDEMTNADIIGLINEVNSQDRGESKDVKKEN